MTAGAKTAGLSANAGAGKRFAVVVSRYHEEITRELHKGAVEALRKHGVKESDILTVWVPGAFELPLAARACSHQEVDAIVALGLIVKGETIHDEVIAAEVARGLGAVAQASGLPVGFGVLTTHTLEQAAARAGGAQGHKGAEAALAALEMIGVLAPFDPRKSKDVRSVGFGGR